MRVIRNFFANSQQYFVSMSISQENELIIIQGEK